VHAGLTWQGRPHSGIDDARNTADLMIHLIRDKNIVIKQSGKQFFFHLLSSRKQQDLLLASQVLLKCCICDSANTAQGSDQHFVHACAGFMIFGPAFALQMHL
jgi:hypothetical protein